MINEQLLKPKSIVVVGASNNLIKPGGSSLKNLLHGTFKGKIYAVNAKEDIVQGLKSYRDVNLIPNCDLAIISIPSKSCLDVVKTLAYDKGVKAFIIFSGGFSEETIEGAIIEKEIAKVINDVNGVLIGPNCTGFVNANHQSYFTTPIPELSENGVDIISSSGGTATYIIEAAMRLGLKFNSIWSIGNATIIGVEDILEYMDKNFDSEKSSLNKLIYIENIKDSTRFLRHASSLIQKGCNIAVLKSGTTDAGSRAASSHTGAIASSDLVIDALLKKAGIIRCFSREELANIGAVLSIKALTGNKFAIITHAGGPGVILTDALSKGGITVPALNKELGQQLKKQLLNGTSVQNPIDILGTGTGEHLVTAIDFCEQNFTGIDGIAVIYGNPGVSNVGEAYDLLDKKIKNCKLPIFPVFPSVITAEKETKEFISKGHVVFSDECVLANALSKVINRNPPIKDDKINIEIDTTTIRATINKCSNGYIDNESISSLFDAVGIPYVSELTSSDKKEILKFANKIGFPIVAKCVGPLHKSDVGGVVINIKSEEQLSTEFDRLINIKDSHSVMIQPMLQGEELFIGAKYEPKFGHLILCGLGGIFVEVLKDVSSGLCPISHEEASIMVRSLKGYKILEGIRGKKGINIKLFEDIIVRLSLLLEHAPEIKEMDINPLLANNEKIIAVDTRIRIEKL